MFFKLALISCVVAACYAQYGSHGHGHGHGGSSYSSLTHHGHNSYGAHNAHNAHGAHGLNYNIAHGHEQGHGHGHGHDYGHHVDYHAHPKYDFKYGVSDKHTHDYHSQQESRDGDKVHGEYSLHEADGTIRIVKYTADHKNGFNAEVIRKGHALHPETHVQPAFVAHAHHDGHSHGHGHY